MIQEIQNPAIVAVMLAIFIVGFTFGFIVGRKKERTDTIKKSDFFAVFITSVWASMHGYSYIAMSIGAISPEVPFMFNVAGFSCLSYIMGEGYGKGLREIINAKL